MFNPELAARVVRKLSEGNPFRWFESEQAREEGLPSPSTIRRWRVDHEDFDALCARACEASAEADYDKMEELEERVLLPPKDPKHVDSHAANVVLGNMRWRMERRAQAKFGNRQKIEHSGKVGIEALIAGEAPKE